MENYESGIPNM